MQTELDAEMPFISVIKRFLLVRIIIHDLRHNIATMANATNNKKNKNDQQKKIKTDMKRCIQIYIQKSFVVLPFLPSDTLNKH